MQTSQSNAPFAALHALFAPLQETTERPGEKGTRYATQPSTFIGRVVECSFPFIGPDGQPAFSIVLEHLKSGTRYTTRPFSDIDIFSDANLALANGTHLSTDTVWVIPAGQGRERRPPELEIIRLAEVQKQVELLGVPGIMIELADKIIDELRLTPGALEDWLLSEGYGFFDAVPSSRSGRMRQCERAVLLQALSAGQVCPGVNPRISMLTVSRPGTSKKLMSKLALLYAPLGQLIHPANLSLAGMSAAVQVGNGGFVSRPGALANCHKGVAVIEDIHRISRKLLSDIQAALMAVAEDARTIQTKVSAASFAAETALHMNANLQSVVHARLRALGVTAKLQDLGLPADLLSRMDIIIELTVGDNPVQQAQDIVAQKVRKVTPERKAELADKELLLKTVVARLIDRFDEVRFDGYEAELRRLMGDIALVIGHFSAKMTEEQQQLFDGGGLYRRIANSIRKIVSASARLSARDHIIQEDIDTAWDMLSYKLEVIRWICDDSAGRVRMLRSRQEIVAEAQKASSARWLEIQRRYGGRKMAVVQIALEMDLAVRTVGQELELRGYYPEFGVCQIPTLTEETDRLMRREPVPAPPEGYSDEHHLLPEGMTAEQAVAAAPDPAPPILLPPPDTDLNRMVMALRTEQLQPQRDEFLHYFLQAGFDFVPGEAGTHRLADMVRYMVSEVLAGTEENRRVLGVLRDRLSDPDDLRRGTAALQLITFAGYEVPTFKYHKLLTRDHLPGELRQAITSILEREQWDIAQAKLRQEQEERAAHLIAESRIFA